MNKQPIRYFRSIQVIVIIFFLAIAIDGRSETGLPTCSFVAEQGLTKAEQGLTKRVSVLVSKTAERPGLICAQIVNRQETITITYGYGDIRLERLWFGIVWSSSLHLKDFFWRERHFVPLLLLWLKPGETRDYPLATGDEGVSTGGYRVHFCYHVVPEEKEQQCVYSETISFP